MTRRLTPLGRQGYTSWRMRVSIFFSAMGLALVVALALAIGVGAPGWPELMGSSMERLRGEWGSVGGAARDEPSRGVVGVGVADVRREPRADSELVTQGLLGVPVRMAERVREWRYVRLPDYEGWIREAELAPAESEPAAAQVMVSVPRAQLEVAGPPVVVYAGTVLPLREEDPDAYAVELPDGRPAWLSRAEARKLPLPPAGEGAEVVRLAQLFLGTPYLWGGITVEGLDCSGFVQTVYRVAGYTLPRDADPQWRMLERTVARADLRPGDLLFFGPEGRVTHVGIYVGGDRFVQAAAFARGVVVSSLDPASADYDREHTPLYLGARRVIPGRRD